MKVAIAMAKGTIQSHTKEPTNCYVKMPQVVIRTDMSTLYNLSIPHIARLSSQSILLHFVRSLCFSFSFATYAQKQVDRVQG